jgi:predicted transcriptional regulator
MQAVKEEAIKLISNLPDDSSWDDIIYEMYVKKKIEIGLKAADEGDVISHEEVKKRFAK